MKGSGEIATNGVSHPAKSTSDCEQKNERPIAVGNSENSGTINADTTSKHPTHCAQNLNCDDSTPQNYYKQVLGTIIVALTHLGIGAIYGFPGVTLPQLTRRDSDDIYLSPNNAAFFGSLVNIGAAAGSVSAGVFLVRFGQRVMLLVALPVILCTWLLQFFSSSIPLLLICRFLQGLIVGLLSTASNTYVMELSHKHNRGLLFGIVPTIRQFGYFLITVLGNSHLTWRQMCLVCGFVTTLPSFIGLFFLPNSPRWLVTRGKIDAAEKSLVFFRGNKHSVKSELDDIVRQVEEQNSMKSSFFTQVRLLRNKSTLPKFLIILFITVVASFNGSFVVVTYLVPIFQSASSDVDAYISALLVGVVRIIGTLISMVIVDRLGRRPLLIISYFLNALALATLGGYFYAERLGWETKSCGWLPLTTLIIFTLGVTVGGSVISLLRGELVPTSVRQAGFPILVTAMFTGGFIVTQIYPLTTATLGEHGAFWIYSGACATVSVFSFFVLPETRGKSLEEISRDNKRETNTHDAPQSKSVAA